MHAYIHTYNYIYVYMRIYICTYVYIHMYRFIVICNQNGVFGDIILSLYGDESGLYYQLFRLLYQYNFRSR